VGSRVAFTSSEWIPRHSYIGPAESAGCVASAKQLSVGGPIIVPIQKRKPELDVAGAGWQAQESVF
jgi:hypothetical protein